MLSLSSSQSPSPSVSLTVSSSFEFPWADVSARVLTASPTHNWAEGGGLTGAGGKAQGFGLVLGGKEDFRSLSLFISFFLSISRLASLCDLWSLTSCLHMGGHGCGVEGVLK